MATDAEVAASSAEVPSTLPAHGVPTSPGGGASAAAVVVLDKLASLDVARRAERERRREESRAAADPRESITHFLRGFAARQRCIEDAIQRMLQQQQLQQQPASSPATAASTPTPASAAASGGAGAAADADAAVAAVAARVQEVSSATPELVASSLELLGAEVVGLEQSAAAASYYLPPYDQKQCAGAVAALRAAIDGARTTLAPRKKFAFGSKKVTKVRGEEISSAAATTSASAAATAADAAATAAAPAFGLSTLAGAPAAPTSTSSAGAGASDGDAASAPTAAGLVVSDQDRALVARGRGVMGLTDQVVVISQAQLEAEGGGGAGGGGDFVLIGLTRCTVVLLGRLRALRAAGLRGCTVVAGPVTGACFVDDVRDCTLALATYQVRVHRAHATDLFLRVRSKPIIEHSTGIRVAPWAALLPGGGGGGGSGGTEPRLEALLGAHMLGEGEETGCWQQVEDFGWIKAVQSPNWSIMPAVERPASKFNIPAGVWAALDSGHSSSGGGGSSAAGPPSASKAASASAAAPRDSAAPVTGKTEQSLGVDDEL
ncbi:hypothetical protein HYH02_009035 [Chlamydomonas schloesseri]|uniref:C-CAP/cofactor C-like domain-containing protein n=1 Tax=Chlamydomonas schloesseri TaxID=2026947 RepID=A0A835WB10_9CHLO|nr:hypothetical protein HYH02_009035 [Chlamydomonas schloesseri]|eukprot:KAG2444093.1 hypothetical protein HYH02_009035 [Chlamydomonas schloesseri]